MIIFKEEREIGEINFNSIVYLTFYIQNISISAFNECKIIESMSSFCLWNRPSFTRTAHSDQAPAESQ